MSVMAKRLGGSRYNWYGGRPWPGDVVLDVDTVLSPRKGAQFVYAVSAIFLLPVWAYALVISGKTLLIALITAVARIRL